MSSNKDPRRLPVYVDRVNGRLLADPQTGGPWFVVSAGGGGGSVPPGTLTEPGIVQLEDSVSSTSTTKAATPNSVRQAFSLAETANIAAAGAQANATTALNNSQTALNTANSISGTATQANNNATAAVNTANAASATANNAANAVNSKLDRTGDILTGDLIVGPSARLGFEGTTDNVFETYLAVQDPTADRTITLPNASGTVPLLETANTWTSTQAFSGNVSFVNASFGGQLYLGTGGTLVFEGSSDDGFETFVYANNPTQDRSIYFPDATGTVALVEGLATVATSGSYNDLTNKPTLGTAAALNAPAAGDATAAQVVKGDDTRLATNLSYNATTRALGSSNGSGATLPLVANATAGLAPASGGGTEKYLRADGTWEVPPGSLGTDGDRGDITISNAGATWTIDNGVVTYSKMQAVSTGNRILGKAGATPGPIEEIPCTQVGRDLIGASDTATQRTILGLGALAQQDSLGFIGSDGSIGGLAGQPIITTTGGQLTTGNFGTSAGTFCAGNDARLSDSRTTTHPLTLSQNGDGAQPGTNFNGGTARTISFNSIGASADTHTHGNISRTGAIGTTANLPVITSTNGLLATGEFGSTANTFCAGNDSRLSDTRNTTNAVTFNSDGNGNIAGTSFDGSAARTISFNTIGAASSTHSHGAISNSGAIGNVSGLPIITGAGGALQAGAFGTAAGTFCQGNDARLSDARSTVNSLTFNSTGSGDPVGTTFNGSLARAISYNTIGAAAATHSHGNITSAGLLTGAGAGVPLITGTGGVIQAGTFGTTVGTFCQGNDSRLSDARNTTNALSFSSTGNGVAPGSSFNGSTSTILSYNTIGAASATNPVFTGTLEAGSLIQTGRSTSSGAVGISVGGSRLNSDFAYLDLVSTSGSVFNTRLIRDPGVNGDFELINSGTGSILFNDNNSVNLGLKGGRLVLGNSGVTSTTATASWAGRITGGTSATYHDCTATISSDTTNNASAFSSSVTTANSASAFTLGALSHFEARGSSTRGTNTTISVQYGFRARDTLTAAGTNYGFFSGIANGTNRYNFYAVGTAPNYFTGLIISLGSYSQVTANPANLNIDSGGNIQRSTSSIRYKTDVEDLEEAYADNVIFNARPVWYRSLSDADNSNWSWYGLIAEELAELDPRLVFWGRPSKEVLVEEAKDEVVDDSGNVIEPAQEAVYTNEPDLDADLQPEGVAYDRLTVLLINVVQRQQRQIEELQEAVKQLQGVGTSGG